MDVKALASLHCCGRQGHTIPLIRLGFDFGRSVDHGLQHRLWAASRYETPEERTHVVEERIGHRRD